MSPLTSLYFRSDRGREVRKANALLHPRFENCAADQLHLPNLQGKFLRRILRKRLPEYHIKSPAAALRSPSLVPVSPDGRGVSIHLQSDSGFSGRQAKHLVADAAPWPSRSWTGQESPTIAPTFSGVPMGSTAPTGNNDSSPTEFDKMFWVNEGWETISNAVRADFLVRDFVRHDLTLSASRVCLSRTSGN